MIGLLAWFLLAQTALVVHRVDHNSDAHGVFCSLCSVADHAAAVSHDAPHVTVAVTHSSIDSITRDSATIALALAYHSRAPPTNLPS